ncbi:MAG: hypothetical protein AAF763_02860 [Pseudomonadota bacterium]
MNRSHLTGTTPRALDPLGEEKRNELGARHGQVTGVWRTLLISFALALLAVSIAGALFG